MAVEPRYATGRAREAVVRRRNLNSATGRVRAAVVGGGASRYTSKASLRRDMNSVITISERMSDKVSNIDDADHKEIIRERKIQEECGVFGVSLNDDEAVGLTYNALLALQHRGQESAGIAVLSGRSIRYIKDQGLVKDIFNPDKLDILPSSAMSIGHVRYSKERERGRENAQPMVIEFLRGRLAIACNCSLINSVELLIELEAQGCDLEAATDAEVIATMIAMEALEYDEIEDAVVSAVQKLKGAFSFVALSSQGKLIAVRDGWGFKPLCFGEGPLGIAVASESSGLDSTGFKLIRDVAPGEVLVIDHMQNVESRQVLSAERKGVCMFEYVYFARPDSIIDELSVYQARFKAGQMLAKEHPVDADVVCGVPDSGLEAAQGYSAGSGLPYVTGFLKNRYIGRSFIYPSVKQRAASVRVKLNPLKANLNGKKVVVVDDSIVRGTTLGTTIKGLRDAGAVEIHLRIACPPFKNVCYFGTDVEDAKELIANQMSIEEYRKQIGADSLRYISLENLLEACEGCALDFCVGCFNDGGYPIKMT